MENFSQVFVDLQFQGRLRKSDELHQAEVWVLKEYILYYGLATLDVPGYCVQLPMETAGNGRPLLPFWFKLRGEWKPLWLLVVEQGVAVLCDRRP